MFIFLRYMDTNKCIQEVGEAGWLSVYNAKSFWTRKRTISLVQRQSSWRKGGVTITSSRTSKFPSILDTGTLLSVNQLNSESCSLSSLSGHSASSFSRAFCNIFELVCLMSSKLLMEPPISNFTLPFSWPWLIRNRLRKNRLLLKRTWFNNFKVFKLTSTCRWWGLPNKWSLRGLCCSPLLLELWHPVAGLICFLHCKPDR